MGGGVSINQDAITSLKEESEKPIDLSDNPSNIKEEIIKIRTLMIEFKQFKQFEQEACFPIFCFLYSGKKEKRNKRAMRITNIFLVIKFL